MSPTFCRFSLALIPLLALGYLLPAYSVAQEIQNQRTNIWISPELWTMFSKSADVTVAISDAWHDVCADVSRRSRCPRRAVRQVPQATAWSNRDPQFYIVSCATLCDYGGSAKNEWVQHVREAATEWYRRYHYQPKGSDMPK